MQRLEVSGAVRPLYGSLGVTELTGLFCEERWGAAASFCQISLLQYCGLQEGVSEAAETGNKPGGPRDLHISDHVDHISYQTRWQTGSEPLLYRKVDSSGVSADALRRAIASSRPMTRADELLSLHSQFARAIPRFLRFKDTCSGNFGYDAF